MKLDIPARVFDSYSNEKKKKYIANLLIKGSGATPVKDGNTPIAFVMAGLPGAGKTEFLDSLDKIIEEFDGMSAFVRIDLDQIVSVYPDYTPKDYYKFRSQGNIVLSRCVDVARRGKYNMMIDGTFSGRSGATVNTIGRLLGDGYFVQMIYMFDKAETAWYYTQQREKETDRGVSREGFKEACKNIVINLAKAKKEYKNNPNFRIVAVEQKELRDKNYMITTEKAKVDKIISTPYNFK